jgi:hypothetical protein
VLERPVLLGWLTLVARSEWGLPEGFVVVYFDGGVDYCVLDCLGDDSPLSIWRPGTSAGGEALEKHSESFGVFFFGIVMSQLGGGSQ